MTESHEFIIIGLGILHLFLYMAFEMHYQALEVMGSTVVGGGLFVFSCSVPK